MTFIAATNNVGKLKEIKRLLEPEGFTVLSLQQANVYIDIEENADTYEGNAELKAVAVCKATNMPAIADDSGLEVDALGGAPGVYTARYAGPGGTPEECIRKLLHELENTPPEKRTARFVCAICCAFPDDRVVRARGVCEGSIATEKIGTSGFGYDPVFLDAITGRSFGELSEKEKDDHSHRAVALRALAKQLKEF